MKIEKECRVVIVPSNNSDIYVNDCPIVITRTLAIYGKIIDVQKASRAKNWERTGYIPGYQDFAHIEFRDGNNLIASTKDMGWGNDETRTGIAKIPQSFVKNFIKTNGTIDKVLIKMEKKLDVHYAGHDYYNHVPKLNKNGEVVIIRPKKIKK